MNQFKDTSGRWITTGLFKETAQQKNYVVYTLDEARELYIAANDITGYTFATTCLGGWVQFQAMKESPILGPIIAQWEEELEVKLRAEGLAGIIRSAGSDKGFQAQKFLAEAGWKPKETGRPTKERIEREARVKSKMYSEFDNIVELKKK